MILENVWTPVWESTDELSLLQKYTTIKLLRNAVDDVVEFAIKNHILDHLRDVGNS